jgi:hypothetical protein
MKEKENGGAISAIGKELLQASSFPSNAAQGSTLPLKKRTWSSKGKEKADSSDSFDEKVDEINAAPLTRKRGRESDRENVAEVEAEKPVAKQNGRTASFFEPLFDKKELLITLKTCHQALKKGDFAALLEHLTEGSAKDNLPIKLDISLCSIKEARRIFQHPISAQVRQLVIDAGLIDAPPSIKQMVSHLENAALKLHALEKDPTLPPEKAFDWHHRSRFIKNKLWCVWHEAYIAKPAEERERLPLFSKELQNLGQMEAPLCPNLESLSLDTLFISTKEGAELKALLFHCPKLNRLDITTLIFEEEVLPAKAQQVAWRIQQNLLQRQITCYIQNSQSKRSK